MSYNKNVSVLANNRLSLSGSSITLTGSLFGTTVSGTVGQFSSLSASSLEINQAYTFPASDGDPGQILVTDGAGNLGFQEITTTIRVKNLESTEITKGTPLYVTASGTSGNIAGVYRADAGNDNRMPAACIANENIAADAEGLAILSGFINGVNTSLFDSGDAVYVAVGGGYTNVRPTGSARVQPLGYVEKSAVSGSGVVQGPNHFWDLPNITAGHFWVGASNGVPTTVASSSFAKLAEQNTFTQNNYFLGTVGIGTSTPSSNGKLHVYNGSSGATTNPFGGIIIEDSDSTYISLATPSSSESGILFADPSSNAAAQITYSHLSDVFTHNVANSSGGTFFTVASLNTLGIFSGLVQTYSGVDFRAANTLYVVSSTNRVGIGQDSPSYKLDVIGDFRATTNAIVGGNLTVDTNTLFVDSAANEVGIGTTTPNAKLDVNGNAIISGSLTVTGTITELSTRKLKKNIRSLKSQLDTISMLNPVSYYRKDTQEKTKEYGFISEEVREVYPEFVSGEGVNYSKMVSVLVSAVKELKEKIEEQQKEIDNLKKIKLS